MAEDRPIRAEKVEQRSASVNAGLGIAAFAAVSPHLPAAATWAKEKVAGKQTPKVELPPGVKRP